MAPVPAYQPPLPFASQSPATVAYQQQAPGNYAQQAPGNYAQQAPGNYPPAPAGHAQHMEMQNTVYQAPGGMMAPLIQTMDMNSIDGLVVRQVFQGMELVAQIAGVPYEQANRYSISAAPPGVRAASDPKQPDRWRPSAEELARLPYVFMGMEESSCCLRTLLMACGGLNLRAFKMHFYNQGGMEHMLLDRPCKCGGGCGCPLELTVFQAGARLGRVKELYTPYCSQCCTRTWRCIYHDRVLEAVGPGQEQHIFTIRTSLCCCGRVNNCCGATCCKDSLILDILDRNGTVVGHIQKTYGGSGCGACCRMALELNNWLVDFPPGTTEAQKALLLGALMHVNYAYFEKPGGDDS